MGRKRARRGRAKKTPAGMIAGERRIMLYTVFLILAALAFFVAIAFAFRASRRYKTTQILTASRIMTAGVFFSSVLLYVPYYWAEMFAGDYWLLRTAKTAALSVHNTIRMFVVDTDLADLSAVAANSGTWAYTLLGAVLLVAAPVLTVTVVLSFFKNFSVYRRYFLHPHTPVYVFSELNELSLVIAKHIVSGNPKALLVFADVFKAEDEEETFEMVERAKELGALCFKKDMLSLNLHWVHKSSPLHFFAIAQDRSVNGLRRRVLTNSTAAEENVRQTYQIATSEYYSKRKNTSVYVFYEGEHNDILLDSLPETGVVIHPLEEARLGVLELLFKHGLTDIFGHAIEAEDGTKEIHALVLGAGKYGSEILKALVWYTQVPGYRLHVDVIDSDRLAEERFAFQCPELMSHQRNGVVAEGYPYYRICFHNGVCVNTRHFAEVIQKLSTVTYAFVALGEDWDTVEAAVALRRLFRQLRYSADPPIHAAVYDEQKKRVYESAHHWENGEEYGIQYVASLEETANFVFKQPEVDRLALELHVEHNGNAADFRKSMYNRRSSRAFVVHRQLWVKLGLVPDAPETEWQQEVLEQAQRIEHCRWVAFMLTEGYVYSGAREKSSDDRFGRLHHNLVPYDLLTEEEKKDTLAWRMKRNKEEKK